MQDTLPSNLASKSTQTSGTAGWTRHLGAALATTLIFVSGTAFVSLLEAFH